jgi:cytochrome b
MTVNLQKSQTLVWDVPVRVFHWLMVVSFAGAYLTAESERWRLIHVTLGYTMGGLVAFRFVWGFVGSRYARFSNFVRGADAVKLYIKSLRTDQPEHHVGHNPAGAVAIVLLLLFTVAIVASGFVVYNDIGGHFFEELHELSANFMLLIVAIHVAGVFVSGWLHKENLVRAMVTGKKMVSPNQGIHSAKWFVALFIILAVMVFWYFQWLSVPVVS